MACFSLMPTEATCGSVNVTCGTLPASATSVNRGPCDRLTFRPGSNDGAADPRLVLAHVGEQRPSGDVADRVQPVAGHAETASWSSVFTKPRLPLTSTPTASSPMSVLAGVRPVATTTSSTVMVRSPKLTVT